MLWADLRAAIGQRLNCEGIISSAKVITKDHNLAVPHLTVPDIRWINWSELRKRGFNGVIFDKDNTLTLPYSLTLWAPLKSSLERCKAEFGEDNVAILSNTAGLLEFDPDGLKARELEREFGIKVIRHKMKKPAGDAEEIEKHFGCSSSTLVMVGDRHFTDVVYGNRNGFLTVLSQPLSVKGEPLVVRLVRKFESALVDRWGRKGLKPIGHRLLVDGHLGLVNDWMETRP